MGPMGKPVGFFVCVFVCINTPAENEGNVLFRAYFNVVFVFAGAKGSKGNQWRNGKIG